LSLVSRARHVIVPALVTTVAFNSLTAAVRASAKESEIVLPFPNEKGYGTISKVINESELETNAKRTPLGEARGTIKLPAGTVVFYEPGPRFFQNPQILKKIPPDAIKYVKFQFTAMDDSEEGMSDRAAGFLRCLNGLRSANFDKSDTSDAGLEQLAGLKKLTVVTASESMATGSCLKSLATCPNLLLVRFCAIKIDNDSLSHLKNFKSLVRLDLNRCGLNSKGVQNICMCSSIAKLDFSSNPNISDRDLLKLKALKKLKYINLRGTGVTVSGIKAFAAGSQVKLIMPKILSQYSKTEQSEINKIKGNILFDLQQNLSDPDYDTIFGTINRK
jgi:hypothetical protein